MKFKVGDRVRVREGVEPTHGWGRVRPGDVGVVKRLAKHQEPMRVDFPAHVFELWSAVPSEMEHVNKAALRANQGGAEHGNG